MAKNSERKGHFMKTVFLFSGQGSQYPGMGKELAELYPEAAAEIFGTAERVLGFDLKEKMFGGTAEELAVTTVSQPAILAASLLALHGAKDKSLTFTAVAGHSLGEYAAMAASGMLTTEEAFTAIKYRSEAMDKAAKANPGGMAAVINLESATTAEICEKISAEGVYVTPVNYNSPVQTVIAGTKAAIDKASSLLMEAGARRVIPLSVAAAFHSRFMSGAAEEFKAAAKDIPFKTPDVDFFANVTGAKLDDFSDMPQYLAKHICSPVRFVEELNALKEEGYDTYVECGPGKVLTGLVKKTLTDVKAVNIEDKASLEAAL